MNSLLNFSTCDVADALDKLKLPPGHLIDISQKSPGKIIGKIITLEYSLKENPSPSLPSHPLDLISDFNSKNSILIIKSPLVDNAVWGGLMSTRAKFIGLNGIIIDGRIRDIQEHIDIKFPIWSKGISIMGAGRFTKPIKLNHEIVINSIIIKPGMIAFADENGVIVFQEEYINQILELCKKGTQQDDNVRKALQNGMSIKEAFEKYRT